MHSFSSTQIKRNAVPTPVVNEEFDGSKGLSVRLWVYGLLVPIPYHFLSFYPTLAILAPHRVPLDFFGGKFPHCMKYIYFAISYFISQEAYRRFHSDQA